MDSLANTELNDLILAVRLGSDGAFSELVNRYSPMMNKVISSFSVATVSYDEMHAEACVALHRAALSFDLEKRGVTFGLYAKICVFRRLSDLVEKESKNAETDYVDVDSIPVSGNIESRIVGRERIQRYLEAARNILSEYEYRVFLCYVNGDTNAEICAALGKDIKSVENAKQRMFKRLREESDIFTDI